MSIFNGGKSEEHADESSARHPRDAKEFFVWAKQEVADTMAPFADRAEDYSNPQEFIDDLFDELWPAIDAISKASYRNGRQSRRGKR